MRSIELGASIAKVLDSCGSAIFVIDAGHRVLHWNRACEKLTGLSARDVLGTDHHWRAFYSAPRPCLSDLIITGETDLIPRYYDNFGRSELLDEGWHAEGWFTRLGERRRYIIFDAAPIDDGQGRLLAAIETIQDITPLKSAEEKNTKLAAQLSEAFDRIKILNGFLPICATCKKIRDSEGQWHQIEDYIRDHSEARFTHGICADCASQVYADLKLLKKK
jgi:transcriptional regulator with PAS, ATPase and Fis domain